MDTIFKQFNLLMNALNDECIRKSDEDLRLIEDAMSETLDAWTDYMMSQEVPPADEDMENYFKWYHIVERWS